MAFSRRLQSMYRAAWGRTKAGLRSTMYAGLGLVAFTVMIGLSYLVRELASRFPLEWFWTIPLQAGVGLVLWTCIPYLLLERQVHWRRLLATGGASAVCMTILAIGTPIYMPGMMDRATADFGNARGHDHAARVAAGGSRHRHRLRRHGSPVRLLRRAMARPADASSLSPTRRRPASSWRRSSLPTGWWTAASRAATCWPSSTCS